jgi:uncharacterized delta-60 repeat protein
MSAYPQQRSRSATAVRRGTTLFLSLALGVTAIILPRQAAQADLGGRLDHAFGEAGKKTIGVSSTRDEVLDTVRFGKQLATAGSSRIGTTKQGVVSVYTATGALSYRAFVPFIPQAIRVAPPSGTPRERYYVAGVSSGDLLVARLTFVNDSLRLDTSYNSDSPGSPIQVFPGSEWGAFGGRAALDLNSYPNRTIVAAGQGCNLATCSKTKVFQLSDDGAAFASSRVLDGVIPTEGLTRTCCEWLVANGHQITLLDDSLAIKQTFDLGNGWRSAAVAQTANWILAAGATANGSEIVRLKTWSATDDQYGIAYDTSFSGDGRATVPFGPDGRVNDVLTDENSRIVVAGTTGSDLAFARFTPAGALDTSFSGDGLLFLDAGGYLNTRYDEVHALATLPSSTASENRYLVAAGYAGRQGTATAGEGGYAALVALKPDGSLDPGFNTTGKRLDNIPSTFDTADSVALAPDGRVVVAGTSRFQSAAGETSRMSISRLSPTGGSELGFPTVLVGDATSEGRAAGVDQAGNPVAAGMIRGPSGDEFLLARYDGDYSPQIARTKIGATSQANAMAVTAAPDGSAFYLAGWYRPGSGDPKNVAVAKFRNDLTLDPTFNGDGVAQLNLSSGDDEATAVTVQPDGKIVIAGWATDATGARQFAVSRFRPDGTMDSTFSETGTARFTFEGPSYATSVGLYKGHVIAAGSALIAGHSQMAVARFTANGTPDTAFDTDGGTTFEVGETGTLAQATAVQSDGRILLVGSAKPEGGNADFALARLLRDGAPDPSFGSGGALTIPIGTSLDGARAIAVQPDGKAVVAGHSLQTKYQIAAIRVDPLETKVSVNDVSTVEGNTGKSTFLFKIQLSGAPLTSPLTVRYDTIDGTALAASGDYDPWVGTVTFHPGGVTTHDLPVLIHGDVGPEMTETFTLQLSELKNGGMADGSGIGTIVDDDSLTNPPSISISDASAQEGAAETFHVTLSGPSSQTISVSYATAEGAAKAGQDYVEAKGSLTFQPGETDKLVSIALVNDSVKESTESFQVSLSNPVNGAIADGTGIATVVDND